MDIFHFVIESFNSVAPIGWNMHLDGQIFSYDNSGRCHGGGISLDGDTLIIIVKRHFISVNISGFNDPNSKCWNETKRFSLSDPKTDLIDIIGNTWDRIVTGR